jgi:hypothetical protein
MPRVRSQLALQLAPELIARVKAEAAVRGQTITTLVAGWLEQGLSAPPGPAADGGELLARIDAMEARLAALEKRPAPSRPRVAPSPMPVALDPAPLPPPAGAITTAQLAARLGMKRGSLNERIRRAGGARVGLVMAGWRCVGQSPGVSGGPARWLWEPA